MRVLAWPGMPAAEALAEAGRYLGAKIEADVVSSNERLEEQMRDGPSYDLVCPSDYLVERLVARGELLALDHSVLPVDRLAPWTRTAVHDVGCHHSIPLAFGTTGYLCTADLAGAGSWQPLLQPGAGRRVGMLDEAREVVAAALLALGRSPNATAADDLQAAGELLGRLRRYVVHYDSDDFVGPVVAGTVDVHHAWSGPAAAAVRRDPRLRYVVPAEGAVLWITTAAIPASAPDPAASHRLLAELMTPELAALTTATKGFATPNEAARALLPSALREDPSLFPPPRTLRRCHALRDLSGDEPNVLAVYAAATDPGPAARWRDRGEAR
jgi:spermidine/putrescine-binding protein